MKRRQFLRLVAVPLCTGLPSEASFASSYPDHAVRLLVGFPAGGPVDIAARLIGEWLTQKTGQPFDVDNKPGASGNIATREAVRAPPDGYTLLACGPVNTINTTLFPSLDFDFAKDITAVASLYRVPLVIEVNPALPITTPLDLIDFARQGPRRVKVAYAGNGTPQHIGIELFKSMAGVEFELVPYPGSTPALADLVAGRVDAMFDPMPSSIGLIREGKLRPIAVTSPERSAALPAVPAMASALPGYEAGSWFGIAAPRGVAPAIAGHLNTLINEGLSDAGIKARIEDLGGTVMIMTQPEFEQFIETETARHAQVIRAAGLKSK